MTDLARVAATIDALVTLAGGIDDVLVLDGPTPSMSSLKDAVFIGVGQKNTAATLTESDLVGLTRRQWETVDVACAIYSWRGSGSVKDRRDRVVEILESFREALKADPRLGDVVNEATMGPQADLIEAADQSGFYSSFGFTVRTKTLL